jgi:hypothetical protein
MRLKLDQLEKLLDLHGWKKQLNDSTPQISIFHNALHEGREFILPIRDDASDYEDSSLFLLNKLAKIERTTVEKLIYEARFNEGDAPLSSDDMILRVVKTQDGEKSIPFKLANEVIRETENLLLAGSCQAENPKIHYRRMNNKISGELLNKAKFNHTKQGSFILSVSCPLISIGEQFPLGLDEKNYPATRKAFLTLSKGIKLLHEAAVENRLHELVLDSINSKSPLISANLAEALANISASDNGEGIQLSFKWSGLIHTPELELYSQPYQFEQRLSESLYTAATKLKPQQEPLTKRFIGTVEALKGDLTDKGQRAGLIEVLLLVPEVGPVRALAQLDVEAYKLADAAHINGAQHIAITGTLEPRPRLWVFTEITLFEEIS